MPPSDYRECGGFGQLGLEESWHALHLAGKAGHPGISEIGICIEGGKKSVNRELQYVAHFRGDGITVINLVKQACFGKKITARALQDDLRAIMVAANQADFTRYDSKYTLNLIINAK